MDFLTADGELGGAMSSDSAALIVCLYQQYLAKLAVDESTQVDFLTADGEYLYTAAALTVMYCSSDSHPARV